MSALKTDKYGSVIGGGVSGAYNMCGAIRVYGFNTAITANTTTCEGADGVLAPAGSIARTSHATGRGKCFYSDGAKWQFEAIT